MRLLGTAGRCGHGEVICVAHEAARQPIHRCSPGADLGGEVREDLAVLLKMTPPSTSLAPSAGDERVRGGAQSEPDRRKGDHHDDGRDDRRDRAEELMRDEERRAGRRQRKHRQAGDHQAVGHVDELRLVALPEFESMDH